ncbi:GAF domain-containing protein [Argonema antarcticum]|uniref:GAF domain-containing sensor histidine kinase n=1 Tax=Argonema antarcticum TaxID=2942763 RepID=UPI0020123C9D|nr:GAF domain-containing protein [Argonema antarcticum]MCL1474655.1 GAF domain-containing protein [Argonema antarcticum A004/B2]
MTASLPDHAAFQFNGRLKSQILNTSPQEDFEGLTRLAAYVCQTKVALLCLIDSGELSIESKVGLGTHQAYQCQSFCAHAIRSSEMLIVLDALADERFAKNPAVTDHPKIRFYAGVPLVTTEGLVVGTLSVMDYVPRDLSSEQCQALKTISRQVVTQRLLQEGSHQGRKVIKVREMPPEIPWNIVEIFESITDAFFVLDREWRFTYLNSRAEPLLGSKKELIGKCIWDELPEAIGSTFEKEFTRAISRGVTVHFEEFYPPLGIWLEVRANPYQGGLSVYFRDVTARKQSEAMLMDRSRLSGFGAQVGIALAQGGTISEILNRCTQIMIEHLDAVNASIWTVKQGSDQLELQALAFATDGRDDPDVASSKAKCDAGCEFGQSHTAAVCDFIRPDSSIAEKIALTHQAYLTNDLRDRDRLGVTAWLERVKPHSGKQVKAFAGYPLIVEERLVGVMALFSRQPLSEEGHSMLEWVANAIAVAIDRSWARSELLSRRESLLFRLASQIRNSLDLDTILGTAVNEIRSLLQIDRCHFLWCWPDPQHPSLTVTHEACNPNLASLLADYPTEKVTVLVKKIVNLETIRIDDISNLANLDNQEQVLLSTLGVTSQLLIPLATRSGQLGAVVCSHCSGPRPWSDSEVELLKAVVDQLAIAIDQAELFAQTRAAANAAQSQAQQLEGALKHLKHTEAQLVQTEKMSSLGQMVAGIAHEINNPINFIYGNLSYASDYIGDLLQLLGLYQQNYPNPAAEINQKTEAIDLEFLKDDLPKLLTSMQVGTERIRQIVLSLRNFSRLDEAEMKPVNIHEGIDSTLLILQNRFKGTGNRPEIQLIKEYGDLPLVECYAGQLNQVFMNVLSNAIDALENQIPPRIITIRTEMGRRGDRQENQSPEDNCIPNAQHPTPYVQFVAIGIGDNGPGMTPDVRKRLFDPFFTTKPVGKGTGLGLSISYQIVAEKHGGQLKCISDPGQGSEFIIEIPIRPYK